MRGELLAHHQKLETETNKGEDKQPQLSKVTLINLL